MKRNLEKYEVRRNSTKFCNHPWAQVSSVHTPTANAGFMMSRLLFCLVITMLAHRVTVGFTRIREIILVLEVFISSFRNEM